LDGGIRKGIRELGRNSWERGKRDLGRKRDGKFGVGLLVD
jgi:hypothetical protein